MVKLFTHTDLDGVGCAILAKYVFGDNVDIEYCECNEVDEKIMNFFENTIKPYKHVYITDISVSDKVASEIDSRSWKEKITLLDHHPTALGLNKYDWCKVEINNNFEIKTSGTEIFYCWLKDKGFLAKEYNYESIMSFVDLVRNYDTWRWAELGTKGVICKQVNDLLYLYGRNKFITWCLSQIHDCVFPRLYASDELILNIKQKEIDDYVEEKNRQLIISPMCDMVCGFVFAEKYFSELGNRLCCMHPEIDFVAMIDMSGMVSYRTVKESVDLGKDVARLFGGGGHPKAAGSEFSKEIQLKTIEQIFR